MFVCVDHVDSIQNSMTIAQNGISKLLRYPLSYVLGIIIMQCCSYTACSLCACEWCCLCSIAVL